MDCKCPAACVTAADPIGDCSASAMHRTELQSTIVNKEPYLRAEGSAFLHLAVATKPRPLGRAHKPTAARMQV